MRYAENAQAGSPRILFIHGSPGGWEAYAHYLNDPALSAYGDLVAVDRPGYGGSGQGDVVPELREQAKLLAPLLDDAGGPVIVVGHSLGGPIAVRLAIDYPDKIRGVLLLAGSVDPELEAPRWYNRAATWKLVQWIIPDELLWSNHELYEVQTQLRAMEPGWQRIRAPLIAIQGQTDQLVDPRTADYIDSQMKGLPHEVIRVPDQGHFLIWKRPDIVEGALRKLIDETAIALPAKAQ